MSGMDERMAAIEDRICDAYLAAKHGSYDGRSTEKHLLRLLDEFRGVRAELAAELEALAKEWDRAEEADPFAYTGAECAEMLRAKLEAKG